MMRVAPNVTPLILLCYFLTLEAVVYRVAAEVEPSPQQPIIFLFIFTLLKITAERKLDKMASAIKGQTKHKRVIMGKSTF